MTEEQNQFQGYRLECKGVDIAFGVADWSDIGFKNPVLYVQVGNKRTKVASFNSRESAEWFLGRFGDFLEEMGKQL